MATNNEYRYQTLSTPQHVRLLQISNGQSKEQLVECSMDTYDQNSCPAYIALSYMWGPALPSTSILLDGCRFHVRGNLHMALETLREHGVPEQVDHQISHFWIDAMCINQNDVDERNAQVAMMGVIFSQAQHVIAWLGSADSVLSSNVMELARSLDSVETLSVIEASSLFRAYSDLCRLSSPNDVSKALYGREYWTRLWIVQELLLAKDIVVMCGSQSCTWWQLRKFHRLQWKLCPETVRLSPNYDSICVKRGSLDQLEQYEPGSRVHRTVQETFRLDQLHEHFREQKCLDPRDRIFGLIGVAKLCGRRPPVTVDYRKSTVELARELLLYEYSFDKDNRQFRHPFIRRVDLLAEGMNVSADALRQDTEVARILQEDASTYPSGSDGGAVRSGFS